MPVGLRLLLLGAVSLFGLLPLPARLRDPKSHEAIKKIVKNLAGQVMIQMIYPETNCCRNRDNNG